MLKVGFILVSGTDARDYGMSLVFGYLISVLRRVGGPVHLPVHHRALRPDRIPTGPGVPQFGNQLLRAG